MVTFSVKRKYCAVQVEIYIILLKLYDRKFTCLVLDSKSYSQNI